MRQPARQALLVLFLMSVLSLMSSPLWAQASGSQAARHLEAQVLAENLLDFARRSGSARAYLMAAELRLLYPPAEPERGPDVRPLIEQALTLAPEEPTVKVWVGQLNRLARPSQRRLKRP